MEGSEYDTLVNSWLGITADSQDLEKVEAKPESDALPKSHFKYRRLGLGAVAGNVIGRTNSTATNTAASGAKRSREEGELVHRLLGTRPGATDSPEDNEQDSKKWQEYVTQEERSAHLKCREAQRKKTAAMVRGEDLVSGSLDSDEEGVSSLSEAKTCSRDRFLDGNAKKKNILDLMEASELYRKKKKNKKPQPSLIAQKRLAPVECNTDPSFINIQPTDSI